MDSAKCLCYYLRAYGHTEKIECFEFGFYYVFVPPSERETVLTKNQTYTLMSVFPSNFNVVERLHYAKKLKERRKCLMKFHSSKIVVNGNNNIINFSENACKKHDVAKTIIAVSMGVAVIILALFFGCRLLRVSDCVFISILEKLLELALSSIVKMYR